MKTAEIVNQIKEKHRDTIVNETYFQGETTLEIDKKNLKTILSYLKEMPQGFEVLMDLTGVDYLYPTKRTKVVYWLHNPNNYQRIRIITFVNRDESLPSVTSIWEGANWYERELYDLFGVRFDDHPDLTRILMPDDWVGHPLQKDYALTEVPVQFKHGVRPKVPSQIIESSKHTRNISQLGSNEKK